MAQQKPKVKIPSVSEFADQAMRKLFGLTQGWSQQTDILKNNYRLGLEHYNKGNLKDAILRMKLVTWLDPSHVGGWYYLGCSYLSDGNLPAARRALEKAVKLKPDWDEAVYMRAMASGNQIAPEQLPRKMPLALAQKHFDALAPEFTLEQLGMYHYQGHTLLTSALRQSLTPGRIDHELLELGVGTGLCGPLMRDVVTRMVGIDISLPMLNQAKELTDANGRKLYDELLQREMHEYLKQAADGSFDIVLACGVFSYIGPLGDLFKEVVRVLKPGGRFAFTADIQLAGEGYRFEPTAGRFTFSASYLHGLAVGQGLNELTFTEAPVYLDHPMWLCILGK